MHSLITMSQISVAEAAVVRARTARPAWERYSRSSFYAIPDARTAAVLRRHAMGRVEDAYTAFRLTARQIGTRVAVGEDGPRLIDNVATSDLKASLRDICAFQID